MPTRLDVPPTLRGGVVAVLRADAADRYAPVVRVLADSGICSIELTMSTPGTLDVLTDLRAQIAGSKADLGVGTVPDVATARQALDLGADFLVTPAVDTAIVEAAVDRGVPVYPGALTPTEVSTAWRAGATAVKLFPASTVGPSYLSHLRGPFPHIPILPSGGFGVAEIPVWMGAGAIAVSMGSSLLGDALRGGSLTDLARRCRDAVAATGASRP
ncbi:bifunctional 4-hydroxy-2-oxoglutarate aldolase/2-dehydro-3-deoxy-phosphogluconate aldolase [Micromonospora sp.]|uniref:bifunctional 4-hydroxy-2-oxoglutarate aldolase/2-dehydro-3-deoxy-phosphogluconate aldolase n=1 Tax=Micromonospora sp. TaxID=1876 RepID=UPI003B3B3CE3